MWRNWLCMCLCLFVCFVMVCYVPLQRRRGLSEIQNAPNEYLVLETENRTPQTKDGSQWYGYLCIDFHQIVQMFFIILRCAITLTKIVSLTCISSIFIIRPSSDGSYNVMVMSVRPGLRLTLRPSVRPFFALFSYMLWHIELKFCTWLCFNVLQSKY